LLLLTTLLFDFMCAILLPFIDLQPVLAKPLIYLCVSLLGLATLFLSSYSTTMFAFFGSVAFLVIPALLLISGWSLSSSSPTELLRGSSTVRFEFFRALSYTAVCYAGMPAIPYVYSLCRPKREFRRALVSGIIFAGLCHLLIGGAVYYFYGSHVTRNFASNVGFDLDSTKLPGLELCAQVVVIVAVMKITSVLPFLLQPIVMTLDHIWSAVSWGYEDQPPAYLAQRIAVAILVLLASLLFDTRISQFSSQLGCAIVIIANIIFPTACYVKLTSSKPLSRYVMIIVLLFFALGLAFGTEIFLHELTRRICALCDA